MANTFGSLKRVRITEKRTAINRMRKTRMRGAVKAIRSAIGKGDTKVATDLLPATFSMVDRAAKWGIIKKNTAARYKSRITRAVKKLSAPVAA